MKWLLVIKKKKRWQFYYGNQASEKFKFFKEPQDMSLHTVILIMIMI